MDMEHVIDFTPYQHEQYLIGRWMILHSYLSDKNLLVIQCISHPMNAPVQGWLICMGLGNVNYERLRIHIPHEVCARMKVI